MPNGQETERAERRGPTVEVPGAGACLLPREFAAFTGVLDAVERHDARESPRDLHARLGRGAAIVLSGPYAYVDGVFRYCQRFQRGLVGRDEFRHVRDPIQRRAAFAEARRRSLHRLLLLVRGDRLLDVSEPPDTAGLQEWLDGSTGEQTFLIPVRRLQRILTDMRRAREGLAIPVLGSSIALLPHVYVPADASVPAMFAEFGSLLTGRSVLDMGTGTGVLALLAARLGAVRVVATDRSEKAVANARLNAARFGVERIVEVRGPADLFEAVAGEAFDVILFNAPWIQGEPQTLYDTAVYDPRYRVLDGFLEAAPRHLARGGVILLQYSDASQCRGDRGMERLSGVAAQFGLEIVGERHIARVSRVLGARERVFLFEIRAAR